MMRAVSISAVLLISGIVATAQKQGSAPFLPQTFAGWQRVDSSQSRDPAVADPTRPDLLKEYGFSDVESATYARPDRKLTVKAARFRDASGAYGAFTYYKTEEMQTEKIGDQGASANERVLFYRGNLLLQVTLDRVTPMSAAELRELAETLALPQGTARNLPVLPSYLPRQGYIPHTAKYVMGPLGLRTTQAPISEESVNFASGAEIVTGQYHTGEGVATLTLIGYPTPQIAGERLRAIQSAHAQAPSNTSAGPLQTKRSGPMVALISGAISPVEAKSLLASVNYDAEVTWNQSTGSGRNENLGSLLVGVIVLVAILFGLAIIAGVAFGGIRLLLKRLYPGRVFDRSRDVEIIELKIGPLR